MKIDKKILIIEDDSMLLEALVENLTAEGFSVRGCASAKEGFDKIRAEKPDIILTDLVLANLDGFDILKSLKENPDLKEIPVVVLSNLGEKEDIERAMSLGATDFLVKAKLSLEEVTQRVKKALRG